MTEKSSPPLDLTPIRARQLSDDCLVYATSVERQNTPWAHGCASLLRQAAILLRELDGRLDVQRQERDAARVGLFQHLTGEHKLAEPTYAQLLAEVDRLRALESYWQINHHAIRNDWTAAEKRAESAEARLAAIQALVEKWRKENGDYPESKLDCAADIDAAINQK